MVEAKKRGAKVIHVDPRFTRTSALADRFVAIRAGSDIAFLGGVVNHILSGGLDFREYVLAYTNAATIVSDDYQDTEDLDGLFSGWDQDAGVYDPASWQYAGHRGEGPRPMRLGKYLRFDPVDVATWIEARKACSAERQGR